MGRDFIIRKGLPLRKEKGNAIHLLLKKSNIFKKGFGIPKMRDNDQKGSLYLFPQMGQEIGVGRARKVSQSNTFPFSPWFRFKP
jgi:hypothetical protein